MIKDSKTLREWIMIGLTFGILLAAIWGAKQIQTANINLERISAKSASFEDITVSRMNLTGDESIIHYSNKCYQTANSTGMYLIC